jgi:hypothetical protein
VVDVLARLWQRVLRWRGGKENADRRRAPRLPERRATANIEGVSYPLRNWNQFGFMVSPYLGEQKIGFRIKVRVVIPFEGQPVGISADAKIVRIDRRRQELAAEFIDLDAKTKQQLERIFGMRRSAAAPAKTG